MKIKRNVSLIILYLIIVIGFGFWWANNFDKYTHFKGEESFFEIEFISLFSFFTLIIFKFINHKIPWLFVILIPLSIGILAAFITLFIPVMGLMEGTTLDNLRVYGIVYALFMTILFCVCVYTNKKDRTNHA